jgi:hypothetical protein
VGCVSALTGAFAAFFVAVFTAAFFATVFFTAAFFVRAGAAFAAAARVAAHLFFVASEIAFRPAALSLRFGFDGSGLAFAEGFAPFAGGFLVSPEDA